MPKSGIAGSVILTTSVTPTISTSAYSTGYVMGGILTFANMFKDAGGSGILENAVLSCKTAMATAADLYVFSALPTGTYTDKAALVLTAADEANLIDIVHLSDITASGSTIPDVQQMAVTAAKPEVYNNDATLSTNLYALLVVRQSITPGSTTDTVVELSVKQD